jgi:carbon-monoxide dehydrogenase large subunit
MTGYIGQSLQRVEDARFLTGAGAYTADLNAPGQAHAVVVRSPHAHAMIRSIDAAAAGSAPGVLAVYTHRKLRDAGIVPIASFTRTEPYRFDNIDGSDMADSSQYPFAIDRVRYVGEPVAMVVAETLAQALEAAELVQVDYDELEAVTTIAAALDADAPLLWPELPDNRSFDWQIGEDSSVDACFASADHVVDVEVDYPRRIVAFMEPRAALAQYDDRGRYDLQVGCQSAHWMRDGLALALGVESDVVHVSVPDVGGGFGTRAIVYPEYVATLHAARDLGRPVKWVADRSESFSTDAHARSQRIKASLALDAEGRFLGIRMAATWEHGGYLAPRSVFVLLNAQPPMVCGPYRIAHRQFSLHGVFTNTTPIASYRGVGRCEAAFALERLVDAAARVIGIDPITLRRRNLIAPDEMPFAAATGLTYERVDFEASLDSALQAIDYEGFSSRRDAARARGALRGLGVATYIQTAGGAPDEYAEVRVTANGEVALATGTQDFGMGHRTAFAQVAADLLGVDPTSVSLTFGDTDKIPRGQGGHGSRCMRIGGNAIAKSIGTVIEQGREIAGDMLEVAADDVAFTAGRFEVAGTDRSVGIFDVAAAAEDRGTPLKAYESYMVDGPTMPNGCHACEVEIDVATGMLTLERFVTVIDPGTVINPMLAAGQMHGGVAMGIGEAMLERVVYDPQSGQLLSGSFMDYAMPRADDLPMIETLLKPVASSANPLGVKGIGEAGTMTSPAAVVNAINDALAERGVSEVEAPLTSELIWQALQKQEF